MGGQRCPVCTRTETRPSPAKDDAVSLVGFQRHIMFELLPPNTTINSAFYCSQIDHLHAQLVIKRPYLDKVCFLHTMPDYTSQISPVTSWSNWAGSYCLIQLIHRTWHQQTTTCSGLHSIIWMVSHTTARRRSSTTLPSFSSHKQRTSGAMESIPCLSVGNKCWIGMMLILLNDLFLLYRKKIF